jgi:KDO2-lipid IV(A) lauroyltransferase
VPSLSRFAKLGRASVLMMVTRLTKQGYEVELLPAFKNFPTDDAVADTVRMNDELAAFIRRSPEQYYWVHKRFKTRPPGEASVYQL